MNAEGFVREGTRLSYKSPLPVAGEYVQPSWRSIHCVLVQTWLLMFSDVCLGEERAGNILTLFLYNSSLSLVSG